MNVLIVAIPVFLMIFIRRSIEVKIAFVHKENDKYNVSRPGGAIYVNMRIGQFLREKHRHLVHFYYNRRNLYDERDNYGNFHFSYESLGNYLIDCDVVIGSCVIWPLFVNEVIERKIVLMHDRINKCDEKYTFRDIKDRGDVKVICLSQTHADSIRKLGYDNSIYIIRNGYDSNIIGRKFANFTGKYNRFRLVYSAATNGTKGLDLTLEAFKILKEKTKCHYTLDIFGDSMLHSSDQEYILSKYKSFIDGDEDISVHGFKNRDDLYSIYSTSGIFLAPSRLEFVEPCPLGPIDAQVCGLPVLASSSGALPELVENKKCGIIMDEYSSRNMAECIMYISEDFERWHNYSYNCSQTKDKKFFTWEIVADMYNELIVGPGSVN